MRHLATCSLVSLFAALLLLPAACGGRNEPDFDTPRRDGGVDAGSGDDGGEDGGALDAGSDGGTLDAGGDDGGGFDAGAEDAGSGDAGTGTPMRATITLSHVPQVPVSNVEAIVSDVFEPPPAAGCSNAPYDPDAVDTTEGFDAGAITVGGLDGPAVTLEPVTGGPYGVRYQAAGSVPEPLFRDGNVITANAAGGPDLGAFSVNMTTPQAMSLTTPTPGATVANRSAAQALEVRWTPGGGDQVLITLTPADTFFFTAVSGTMVVCVTTDSGSFDIPAQYLPPVRDGGAQFGNAFLGVTRSTSVTSLLAGGSQAVLWAGRSSGAAVKLQ